MDDEEQADTGTEVARLAIETGDDVNRPLSERDNEGKDCKSTSVCHCSGRRAKQDAGRSTRGSGEVVAKWQLRRARSKLRDEDDPR